MHRIKRTYLFLIFILSYGILSAQEYDHLIPTNGFYDTFDSQFESNSQIRKILLDSLWDFPHVRFLAIYSSKPEIVVDINHYQKKDTWEITFRTSNGFLHLGKPTDSTKITEKTKAIPNQDAELVKELYRLVISQTKYPERKRMGFHGTNYYFIVEDFGMRSGTVWSPIPKSKMGKLVDISNDLVKYANDEIEFDTTLTKKIKVLIAELK